MNWLGRRWRFQTRLTPEQCAERLRGNVDGDFNLFGMKPVIGYANVSGASLRKRIWFRNSFQSVLRARFHGEPGSTVVECRSGISHFAIVFMVGWSGALLLTGGNVFLAVLANPSADGMVEVGFILLGMIAFMAILLGFGRWLARNEDAFLEQFLRDCLEAGSLVVEVFD